MDWSKGYSVTYYAKRVDPATWRDLETIKLTGGSIKREPSGLRESADIECVNYDVGVEQWIRVYLDTRQDGSAGHEALFTGLATSPDDELDGRLQKNTLECYSVLKPADDVYLLRGWYAPAGARGGDVIRDLLSVSPAPIRITEDSPQLSTSVIAEDGETRLTMAEKILDAIGWRIRIDGDGTINVEPKPLNPAVTFDPLENDVIETELKISADWYSCPNVYLAINEDLTGIARDDSPDSPLSTVNRGREVWMVDSQCELAQNESIGQYAQRKLIEAQRIQRTAEYDRRYMPGIVPGDLVRLHYPAQKLDGIFNVESQTIELGYGAKTSERVSTVVVPDSLKKKQPEVTFVRIADDLDNNIATADSDFIIALTEA